jgi:ribosomal protein L39E
MRQAKHKRFMRAERYGSHRGKYFEAGIGKKQINISKAAQDIFDYLRMNGQPVTIVDKIEIMKILKFNRDNPNYVTDRKEISRLIKENRGY